MKNITKKIVVLFMVFSMLSSTVFAGVDGGIAPGMNGLDNNERKPMTFTNSLDWKRVWRNNISSIKDASGGFTLKSKVLAKVPSLSDTVCDYVEADMGGMSHTVGGNDIDSRKVKCCRQITGIDLNNGTIKCFCGASNGKNINDVLKSGLVHKKYGGNEKYKHWILEEIYYNIYYPYAKKIPPKGPPITTSNWPNLTQAQIDSPQLKPFKSDIYLGVGGNTSPASMICASPSAILGGKIIPPDSGGTPTTPPSGGGGGGNCSWVDPGPITREAVVSLVKTKVINKGSSDRYLTGVNNFERVILDEEDPEELFNNPITEEDYQYSSVHEEHHFTHDIQSTQRLIYKDSYFVLTSYPKCWNKNGCCGCEVCCNCKSCKEARKDSKKDKKKKKKPRCTCSPCVWSGPHVKYSFGPSIEELDTVRYNRDWVELQYSYFNPFDIGTKAPYTLTTPSFAANVLIRATGFSLGLRQLHPNMKPIEANITDPNPRETININGISYKCIGGLDNNALIPFIIKFSNEQFGIPKAKTDLNNTRGLSGLTILDSEPYYPVTDNSVTERELHAKNYWGNNDKDYPYEVQYYWNGKLNLSSCNTMYDPCKTSLTYDGKEKIGREFFTIKANSGSTDLAVGLRSIRNGLYAIGDHMSTGFVNRPFWTAVFQMGMRYRYGITYDWHIQAGEPSHKIREFHYKSYSIIENWKDIKFPKITAGKQVITNKSSEEDNRWTWRLEQQVEQPIIYGQFNIRTSAGMNEK